MQSRKRVLLSTTVVPLVVFAGVAAGSVAMTGGLLVSRAVAQCAAAKCNPCAAAKPNPCAAAKCNPCAAAKPNPCAAAKCNPCAAAKCNPCAAACNPCNPCAAGACNPCNPCNPCAAGACNPCNPCAAGGGSGVSKACFVPRLQSAGACNPCAVAKCNPCNPCAAAKCNPCNPCAAAECNPCNPCAAAKCNPCNPCAAAKCNPCNPCAAGACNPCNPCAAGGAAELTDAEAIAVYDCLLRELKAAYAKSDNAVALSYAAWPRFSKQPYQSGTHGNRYVQNYANGKARAYGAFEQAGKMPAGAALAKDSFAVLPNGKVMAGPLFIMEKMNAGFYAASDDWRYTMVMPDGSVFGATKGRGAKKVEFCIGCHIAVAPEVDSMMFMPDEYRVIR
jgi:hypothetical protein